MAAADFSIGAFVNLDSITAVSVDALMIDDSDSLTTIGGLLKVAYLFKLSRNVYRTIRTNLVWTIAYNFITVLAATGMLEGIGLILSP
jgi:cation transport ATPase